MNRTILAVLVSSLVLFSFQMHTSFMPHQICEQDKEGGGELSSEEDMLSLNRSFSVYPRTKSCHNSQDFLYENPTLALFKRPPKFSV